MHTQTTPETRRDTGIAVLARLLGSQGHRLRHTITGNSLDVILMVSPGMSEAARGQLREDVSDALAHLADVHRLIVNTLILVEA